MAGPGGDIALVITLTLPENYPSDAPPVFLVEAGAASQSSGPSLERAHLDAIAALLDEQASYMPGMACVSTSIMSALEDLDLSTLDLGEPGRHRSI